MVLALVANTSTDLPRLGTPKLQCLLLPHLGEYAPRVVCNYMFILMINYGWHIHRKRCMTNT